MELLSSTNISLIKVNIRTLDEGIELLDLLTPEDYQSSYRPVFESTVGAHFRHVLEHYQCLFNKLNDGVVCYENRMRDPLLETDIDYARATIVDIKNMVNAIDNSTFNRSFNIMDQISAVPVKTTLARELLFLQSHTTHHYAIIAAITRALGHKPDTNFGVAISTLNHQLQSTAKIAS